MMVAFMRNAPPAFDCIYFITTQSMLINEANGTSGAKIRGHGRA